MKEVIRIACVGDSITYGETLKNRAVESYPSRLREMLGAGYYVRNFGRSGTTLLSNTLLAYTNSEEYDDALVFAADIYIICLGANDLMPNMYAQNKERFIHDYVSLIESFRQQNADAGIILASVPHVHVMLNGYEELLPIWHSEIQDKIRDVAKQTGAELIDFTGPLGNSCEYQPDKVHPNAMGAALLANKIYEHLTLK